MVNYRRVVCEIAVLAALVAAVAAASFPPSNDVYDQRQNGTENYRLNIDGVVIAVAPAEALLAAASEIDLSDLLDIDDLSDLDLPQKPQKPTSSSPSVPAWLLETNKPSQPSDGSQEVTKPEEPKPQAQETPATPAEAPAPAASDVKGKKKDAGAKKREKAERLKNRLASLLIPLLRRNRNH
ncbi:hypothetical protein K1T71_004107 [Dendrolimus kikuchii]|uniref:Uncharacterized protein n=1 Tax=Dendrolimus kikuchii TaxID=765133 RepID=A0ACC1DAS7_9NEOP|nr:hypothetical protein K1T71_004107 [Dendrolimus kikuchii]